MKRKFLLLMIVSMLLTGCYDKTETEERLYVVLMGIDGRSIPESYDIYGDEGRYIVSVGEAKLESDNHLDRMVHFFLYDYKFERVWKNPDADLEKLKC